MNNGAATPRPISAVVVAGGRSVRLGRDKRRLRLWGPQGPSLLEHTVAVMAAHCNEVIVVLNDPEAWAELQAHLVPDIFPEGGSLGGIYSGLAAATFPYAFTVAADMPLLNSALIDWMICQPRDYDVLVPRVGGVRARNRLGVEGFHAIYSVACREPMRRQLEDGNPQVIGFFPQVRVRIIEPEVVGELDPPGMAFKNVNTPEELDEVQKLLAMHERMP
jgi:molybdopterin-guanine dinucleotide biosynthesis protein A